MNSAFFVDVVTASFLEVEINPSGVPQFRAKYERLTGRRPVLGVGYQYQPNKWGGEYRIYFNCVGDLDDEFTNLGIDVERGRRPYRSEFTFRVNNKDFFWDLIRSGFRLGRN